MIAETERLQQQASGTKIRYEAAFVTCRDFDRLFPPELRSDHISSKNNDPFQRVSAVRAQELMRMNYAESVFNLGAPAVYTDRFVVLDDYIPTAQRSAVDFVKIDTDGHDFEVLLGTDALLNAGGALGMSIEAQFHGAVHDYANTFANIDRWMRGHGFSLFDIEVYRYSRGALPAPFVWDIPAQTVTGQVLWGEAVYFRDLADPSYEQMWSLRPTREQVLKLASLFELFGLPDCAAELLQNRREIVGDRCDALLDELIGQNAPPGAYKKWLDRFDRDPESFYRSRREALTAASLLPVAETGVTKTEATTDSAPLTAVDISRTTSPADDSAEVNRLRMQVSRLKKKTGELLERIKRRDEKIDQLTRRLAPDASPRPR